MLAHVCTDALTHTRMHTRTNARAPTIVALSSLASFLLSSWSSRTMAIIFGLTLVLVFRFGSQVLSVYGIESDAASLSRARTPSKYLLYSLLASVLPWLLRRVCPSLVVNFSRTSFGSVVHALRCVCVQDASETPRGLDPRARRPSLRLGHEDAIELWARWNSVVPEERKAGSRQQYISVRIEVSFRSLCACACVLGRSSRWILVLLA